MRICQSTLVLAFAATAQKIVNDNVLRTIDLSTQITRERRAIALRVPADATWPVEYIFSVSVPQGHVNATVSHVQLQEKDADGTSAVSQGSKTGQYRAWLSKKSDRPLIIIDIVYSHSITPYPKVLAQNTKQQVIWTGEALVPSIYETAKQKTKITVASSQIESFTEVAPTEKNARTLTYGPYENNKSGNFPIRIHYVFNGPIITVTNMLREVWVSHWGSNLAIEEWYNIRHDGAKLKGEFSRIDYAHGQMSHHNTQVIKNLQVELPTHATDVYYRDDIGNVSTSNYRQANPYSTKPSTLEFRPRYPLFGGWVYTWYHGYNAPLKDFVSKLDGRYVLSVDFVKGIENANYDNVTVKVVLPEGSYDYKVVLPFEVDKQWQDLTYTYGDTIGRPTLYIQKRNVVDEHQIKFEVSYKFNTIEYLRKPLALATGIFILFLVAILYSRGVKFSTAKVKMQ